MAQLATPISLSAVLRPYFIVKDTRTAVNMLISIDDLPGYHVEYERRQGDPEAAERRSEQITGEQR